MKGVSKSLNIHLKEDFFYSNEELEILWLQ